MSRKFALAAFAAVLANSPMLITKAEAQVNYGSAFCLAGQVCTNRAPAPDPGQARAHRDANRANRNALGIALGVGGLLIGSAIANAQPRHQVEHRFHAEPRRFHAEPRGFSNVSYGYGYELRCRLVERENRWGDIVVRRVCR